MEEFKLADQVRAENRGEVYEPVIPETPKEADSVEKVENTKTVKE